MYNDAVVRYLIRRILLTIPVLLGVATLVFALIHLVPGDPAQSMLGEGASAKRCRGSARRASASIGRCSNSTCGSCAACRAAISARRFAPVSRSSTAIWRTRSGNGGARARRDDRRAARRAAAGDHRGGAARHAADYAAMTVALAGISIPNFWLGPMLAIVFAVSLGWLPVSGRGGWDSLVLPAISLGAALAAILARMTRASLLEELRELYVRAARARGVSNARAILGHALRNSLIPLVTILGLQFGAVLTGAVITETIFAWPGVGRLLIQSIGFRDYPLVQGCILLIAVTYVTVNLVTDLRLRCRSIRASATNRGRSCGTRRVDSAGDELRLMTRVGGVDRHRSSSRARAPGAVARAVRSRGAGALPLRLEGPTGTHWFGLDELGRDILSRVLLGARVSLFVGFVVVGVSATVGTAMGAVAGYYGGRVDQIISRVMDVLLAFPGLLLAIALVAVLGPSLGERRARADGDRLGRLCAAGPRPGASRARVRIRRRGQGARRRHLAGADAARAADGAARRDRAGDARHGRRDPLGSRAQLSWAWAFSRRRRAGAR